jgi:major membrane immunogen (membrane-anchored lipoprotein)
MGVTAALLSVLTSIGNADFTAGTMSNGRHEA